MFKPVSPNINFPELEKEILKKWYKEGIPEKYLHRNDKSPKRFSFLDGPITANNPMGVHHAWGRTYKDLWQRFYNMRGFKQRFQNGFDCQGLWIEVEVEKELGIRNKKDIENLVPNDKKASIAKFVQLCKDRVMKFSKVQTEQSKRLGYFMDWDNSYYTMSSKNNYMIWHFLKSCYEKGWVYKGKDSVPWCPRCETAISQHEMLTEDYKELTHETVFVKLPIITKGWENTYLLIWTTTPWTVPANVAVGVNTKFTYGIWKSQQSNESIIILDKDEAGNIPKRIIKGKEILISEYVFQDTPNNFRKTKKVKGDELLGLTYKAPYDHLPRVQNARVENPKKFHTVVDGSEIVVSEEGTGLLHVAPGAGKEDFDLGKKEKLPIISVIQDDASYLDDMDDLSGKNAKKHPELIIDYIKTKDEGKYLLKSMHFTHRYPACWRCKAELVWKVAEEWYIAMDIPSKSKVKSEKSKVDKTLRQMMMDVAKKINWIPEFGLERELDWLKNMHDWLISKKNRYWGLALPIYECIKCGHFEVIGSKAELKEKSIKGWSEFDGKTPHKPYIDKVKIKCTKCQEEVSRIDDVGNVWLDAGIVTFSTYIDPKTGNLSYTTDKTYWKEWFPADFITESFPGQFKNWFYSMIASGTALENTNPYKTVLGFASVLGEDGRPMHKSWGNAINFNEGADKIGVDVMRWMYVTHNPVENLLFGYKKADETRRKFHLLLWNVYNFFITYASIDKWKPKEGKTSENILDTWVISNLNQLTNDVTNSLIKYDAMKASLAIEEYVTQLSQWYIRRSRGRVGPTVESQNDKYQFYQTLYHVLLTLTKLLAPFIPFISEVIYQNLTDEKSVHLSNWPVADEKYINEKINKEMIMVREVVEKVHAERKEAGIRLRQPLNSLSITTPILLTKQMNQLIAEEVNVKKVDNSIGDIISINLDKSITKELKGEGEARDIIRQIQLKRKELGCTLTEKIEVSLPNWPEQFSEFIKKETLTENITKGENLKIKRA